MSRGKGVQDGSPGDGTPGYLTIGHVARRVGVSASVLRSWETLGLLHPRRTGSGYRLYSPHDLKLLKRARYLRRARGLNPPAIVRILREQGMVRAARKNPVAALGSRLRSLRRGRKLSLAAVAAEAGISTAFLSALERSQMSASVGTLRRLARFYGVNILSFFNPAEENPHLVRPADRKRLDAGRGVHMELLAWGNTVMEPHLFRIAPRAGSGEQYSHDGEEFLYIVRGKLEIALEGRAFRLATGDSFYFESNTPHRWSNPGKREAWVLWVNTPPTF